MIVTNQILLNIFRLIYYEDPKSNKRLLQIRSIEDEYIEFAIIYDENMFLSFTFNHNVIEPTILRKSFIFETENLDNLFINLEETYFRKIYLLAKHFPKKATKINLDREDVYVEIVEIGSNNLVDIKTGLFDQNSVEFEFFTPNLKDTIVPPNLIKPQCKVSADSFRKLLELCRINDQNVEITLQDENIIVKNQERNIASSIKCETLDTGSHLIILNSHQRDFVIIMLNRIMRGSIVNLYMINTLPFVIEHSDVRVYTIHVI